MYVLDSVDMYDSVCMYVLDSVDEIVYPVSLAFESCMNIAYYIACLTVLSMIGLIVVNLIGMFSMIESSDLDMFSSRLD